MSVLRLTILAILVLAGAASAQPLSYQELMRAPADQRERIFAALTPDNRAAIVQQRLEAWLAVHEPDLSARQVALVREAIALATPAVPDERTRAAQDRIGERLACSLGETLASTMTGFAEPVRIPRTWRRSAREWTGWIVNCIV